jgi:hypothetical protein
VGWANCGLDSFGRHIGYGHPAKCDWPGCNAKIDRGLFYACGGMHGDTEVGCEGYFCSKHMQGSRRVDGRWTQVCNNCAKPPSKQRKVWPVVRRAEEKAG